MIEIFLQIWGNKIARQILIAGVLILAVGAAFAVLSRRAERAAEKLRIEQVERERVQRENDGLKLVIGSENTAREVERLEANYNATRNNSNLLINTADRARRRDSREFSNSDTEVWRRFCASFPSDSRCR